MTRSDAPAPDTIAAWTRLVVASRVLLDRVEARLKAEGLPPLGWYDALWELVQAGLVERLPVEEDGRGQRVRITPAGREMRGRIWPVYAGELRALVEAPLRDGEAAALAASLGRLIVAARRVT